MVYFISNLDFKHSEIINITCSEAIKNLELLEVVQLDTETTGLLVHTDRILTIQLGNYDNQYVFDWTTLSDSDKLLVKNFLESDKLFIGWNLLFDLTFLCMHNIYPNHIWDGMIAEQLVYLGYPQSISSFIYKEIECPAYSPKKDKDGKISSYELSYSLQSVALRRCNIKIDKSVRDKITENLDYDIIKYAALDVKWLELIRDSQIKDLKNLELERAVNFESEGLKFLSYTQYCGVKLDPIKWSEKMKADLDHKELAIKKLNSWVIEYCFNNPETKEYNFISINPDTGIAECIINWKSPKQVIPLFDFIGINTWVKDKKANKMKQSVAENQILRYKNQFPIIPLYLELKKAEKVISSYGNKWITAINPKTERLHMNFHAIGASTGRISSGGGEYNLNAQNLPNDKITRSCFVSESDNDWISCDYTGQESLITASITKDAHMLEILRSGRDLHSAVARACWPEILKDLDDNTIKTEYKHLRSDAKNVEFAIFYGGNDITISKNKGFPPKQAKIIYTNFMNTFSGLKQYQDYCRSIVKEKGYITMNNTFNHKMFIYDYKYLTKIKNKFKNPEHVALYQHLLKENPEHFLVKEVEYYKSRWSDVERNSINSRIQNRGACAFKYSSILLFNWLKQNKLLNVVLLCLPAHDEMNAEAPKGISKLVADKIVEFMELGGKPFCTEVHLGATQEIGDHWIH